MRLRLHQSHYSDSNIRPDSTKPVSIDANHTANKAHKVISLCSYSSGYCSSLGHVHSLIASNRFDLAVNRRHVYRGNSIAANTISRPSPMIPNHTLMSFAFLSQFFGSAIQPVQPTATV